MGDIADIVLDSREDGTPIRIGDIGQIRFAPLLRQDYVTRDGHGEAVVGIVMMLIGENSPVVVNRVKEKVAEIEKTLPEGVYIDPFYDRTDLVRRAIDTATENISGGAILVIIMLFLLVGDWRAGLIVASATRLPSVSLERSIELTTEIEKTLLAKFPDEVQSVISKTGRAEIDTGPMGLEMCDIFVMLKPKDQWRYEGKNELIAAMKEVLEATIPANNLSFTQPIELRVQELLSGVRSDIGISLYGDDLKKLKEFGDRIASVVGQVAGAADVQAEQTSGVP